MRNAEIEAAILAAPDDPSAYQVYADWLQSHGDPRGELIMLQHAMRAHNDIDEFARFRKHEEVLRNEHASAWLGAPVAAALHRTYFEWRMGFVDVARIDAPRSDELVPRLEGDAANPYSISRTLELSLAELVVALLDAPCGWLVRTFTLRGPLDQLRAAIAHLPSRNLRRLVLVPSTEQFDATRVLSFEIMRMLNANVDVDATVRGATEKFVWARPRPSKRRT